MEPEYVYDVTDSPLEAADPTMGTLEEGTTQSLWSRVEPGSSPVVQVPPEPVAAGEAGIVATLRSVSRGPRDPIMVATWVAVLVVVIAFWGGMAAIVVGAIGNH